MTATTPGCGSTTDAKKRLAEQSAPHADPTAAAVRAAQAEALRVAARRFVEDMAGVWGGDSQWLTTGTRVAEVAACVLREMAADMESECDWCGECGDHANGCRLGLGPDERGPHRPDCNCAPPYADCVHPPCEAEDGTVVHVGRAVPEVECAGCTRGLCDGSRHRADRDSAEAKIAAVVQLIEQARAEGAAEVLTETIARIEAVTPRENLRGNERRTYWQGVRDALIVVQGQRDAALRGPR